MPIEIVPHGTNIDFIGKRKLCAALSVGLLVLSAVAIPIQGIRLGIDFAGGTEVLVRFEPGVAASDGRVREIVSAISDVDDPNVVRFGDDTHNEFLVRVKGDLTRREVDDGSEAQGAEEEEEREDAIDQIRKALSGAIGPASIQRVDFVGPRVGQELRRDGMLSLLWASIVILAYVAFRFSARFAPGAILAVIHDLLITAGIFVIVGLEFDLRVLAAMLAILGYSLNDTIIIYDRIRENLEKRTKFDLPEVLNTSVNQTLSRTVLTSGTTILALMALLLLGGEVIFPFALAMAIGVVVGTYSSVYIAAPVLLFLEEQLGDSRKK